MPTHKQTITFTAPQAAWLKAEADRLGISVAEMVRRVIDKQREKAS